MIHHKYLNDLRIKSIEPCIFNTAEKDAERDGLFAEERENYGFDSRETWSLDYTYATWLYSHLKLFYERAHKVVNLEFYKFSIPVLYEIPTEELEYKNNSPIPEHFFKEIVETKTQLEAINLMIEYLKNYLELENSADLSADFKKIEYIACATKIFAEVLPAMWW